MSILAKSPEETVRASPGFAQISRALGLLRPSAAEAESLVAAVVGGLQSTNDMQKRRSSCRRAQGADGQADRGAGEPGARAVLKQIGQTTDPDALQALAQALQALPAKLTDAQASQALDPVLKQIGQTTDSDALQTLAQGLRLWRRS